MPSRSEAVGLIFSIAKNREKEKEIAQSTGMGNCDRNNERMVRELEN